MINQLRNEVIKYPLNKKKNINNNLIKEPINEIINKNNNLISQNLPLINNTNDIKEINVNKSTVSFNNSKDFSIYNNIKDEQQ